MNIILFWKVLEGPPLRVNFKMWFDVSFSKCVPKKASQMCATRLWHPKKHLFQTDPLPWNLN